MQQIENINDLRKELLEVKNSMMQLQTENSQLSHRVDAVEEENSRLLHRIDTIEAACVRIMTDDGSGAAMTIMEDEFQTLIISVFKRLRERSDLSKIHDLNREDVMQDRWNNDGKPSY